MGPRGVLTGDVVSKLGGTGRTGVWGLTDLAVPLVPVLGPLPSLPGPEAALAHPPLPMSAHRDKRGVTQSSEGCPRSYTRQRFVFMGNTQHKACRGVSSSLIANTRPF